MQMRKNKAGILLMCLMLVLSSVPVYGAEPGEPGIAADGAADDVVSGESPEDAGDVSETGSDKADAEDTKDSSDKANDNDGNADMGDDKSTEENAGGRDAESDSSPEAELPEVSEDSGNAEEGKTFSKNAVSYDLSADSVEVRLKAPQTQYIYTGAELMPEIEVLSHGAPQTAGEGAGTQAAEKTETIDPKYYEVKYQNNINAGKASVIVTGVDDPSLKKAEDGKSEDGSAGQEDEITCTGTKTMEFEIAPADINKCQFQIPSVAGYTGKAVKVSVTGTYQGKQLVSGKDYSVTFSNNKKKGKANILITGMGNFTGSRSAQFTIKLGAPSVKEYSDYSKIKFKWGRIKDASGYEIYRSTSATGKYKKVKVNKSGKKTTYSDSKAKFGKTYYYKVRTYQNVKVKVKGKTKKKKEYSPWSAVVTAKKKLGNVSIKSAKCTSEKTAKVTWKKVKGAQGYEIYRSESSGGAYVRAGTVKGGGKTSYTAKKLKTGVKYYFKVRAYRKSGSKKHYSPYSGAKGETFSDGQKLYLLFPGGVPTTKAQMEQYLVPITVPIKDANGVPSTMQLRVHKALTKEFMGAFQDMYAIGFPVRAADTDTYNWRSMVSGKNRSHHSYGCVIDLNWGSNPMIGKTEGKYLPGVDPYSVTPQVVAIWKKHGFYWGGSWKSSKDYMHFTYTNH